MIPHTQEQLVAKMIETLDARIAELRDEPSDAPKPPSGAF
jgi:hypothetical protein